MVKDWCLVKHSAQHVPWGYMAEDVKELVDGAAGQNNIIWPTSAARGTQTAAPGLICQCPITILAWHWGGAFPGVTCTFQLSLVNWLVAVKSDTWCSPWSTHPNPSFTAMRAPR